MPPPGILLTKRLENLSTQVCQARRQEADDNRLRLPMPPYELLTDNCSNSLHLRCKVKKVPQDQKSHFSVPDRHRSHNRIPILRWTIPNVLGVLRWREYYPDR